MPRELNLQLGALLEQRAPGMTPSELAVRLGISDGTMHRYFENRWTVLDRRVMERLADFFDCDVASLLTTTESKFFDPFRSISEGTVCLYLRRPDATSPETGRAIAPRDYRAMDRLGLWLQNSGLEIETREHSATTADQFDDRMSQNCVVIGSPIVNPASEVAICRLFGVEPFGAGESGDLPFAFKVRPNTHTLPSSIVEKSDDDKVGIWLRHNKQFLQADSWPRDEFRRRRIGEGRDYAVVLVANYHVPDRSVRKLVVLAGFSGVGTEAAADALADHYQDLEPLEGNLGRVWGIIEVFFKKAAYSTVREVLRYNWRCRMGGRCPMDFTKKKP